MLLALLLLAQGQFITSGCKPNQSCTLANLTLTPYTTVPTCDNTRKGLIYSLASVNAPASLFFCDGFSTVVNQVYTSQTGTFASATIYSRTIASGTITTGNLLLGIGPIPFVPTSSTTANFINLNNKISIICAAAGTGVGNMVIGLKRINNTATTVSSGTVPCATAALALAQQFVSINNLDANATSIYGTTIDVSACTTAPSDCTVTQNLIAN